MWLQKTSSNRQVHHGWSRELRSEDWPHHNVCTTTQTHDRNLVWWGTHDNDGKAWWVEMGSDTIHDSVVGTSESHRYVENSHWTEPQRFESSCATGALWSIGQIALSFDSWPSVRFFCRCCVGKQERFRFSVWISLYWNRETIVGRKCRSLLTNLVALSLMSQSCTLIRFSWNTVRHASTRRDWIHSTFVVGNCARRLWRHCDWSRNCQGWRLSHHWRKGSFRRNPSKREIGSGRSSLERWNRSHKHIVAMVSQWGECRGRTDKIGQKSSRVVTQVSSIQGLENCAGSRLHKFQETQTAEERNAIKNFVMNVWRSDQELRDECMTLRSRTSWRMHDEQYYHWRDSYGRWHRDGCIRDGWKFFSFMVFLPCKSRYQLWTRALIILPVNTFTLDV